MNLPNALALLRIFLAPLLFFILTYDFEDVHQSWVNYFATVVFAIAAMSDFFDGYIARSWKQVTTLGEILDPLADKMLILAAFLGLLLLDRANAWVIYLILIREFFITGFRIVMLSENLDISASFAGKIKTLSQVIAIIFLLMQWHFDEILLYLALFLTLYSGFEYIFKYYRLKVKA
ncbi:CDP-diacylglycerol--glycerol-3-phosphate 3-phosphatidyltransferase [uncultured Campylobacter sp.]|uniref:CDP-diacylglycerol--glycerol-3-phosphate 3-phosphatidyltransferase n=1 Tax=uncultured Campylobacter sp. TaxID=218934 RepID=UPI00261B7E07|nr:CDP-diacylglycerol--glycerol-3-phosphate 3-phosphatidyltransferase [uncultured Campylobacter sp.]